MASENKLSSLTVERHSLAGFLKHPDIFAEVDGFLNEYDYSSKVNQTIFSIIRQNLLNQKPVDAIIVGEKIKQLGISFEIDIFSYLEALSSSQITAKAGVEACKQLVKLRVRRELVETSNEIKEYVVKTTEENTEKILAECDQIYNRKISSYENSLNPIDLFDGVEEIMTERGKNNIQEMGFATPYPYFNRILGGLRNGNVYCFCSRAGCGKSTILNDLVYKTCLINNSKALILDTENLTDDIRFRLISGITQIPCWWLETGNYIKNPAYVKAYKEKLPLINKLKKSVYHIQVSGRTTDEVISLIRRWYLKNVGRGGKCIVVYDYIKLTGENDNNKKEYQLIGDKVNRLKELSVELNVPLLTANQLNRSAENGVDDSSAISQSDRLSWFSTFVGIFRRKTLEEIGEDGLEFGTHKMIITKSRFQGKENFGHVNLVKIPTKGKKAVYKENFISFNIDNFNVEERGNLSDIVAKKKEILDLKQDNIESDGSIE